MDKLKLAHDYALKQIESLSENSTMQSLVSVAWQYADAMQAEADKRKPSGLPDALCEVDWNQAPEWAVAWTMDSGETLWWSYKPVLNNGYWFIEDSVLWKCAEAPSFGFTGTHIVERPHGF